MSWFSEYVGDPLKAMLAKAIATGDAELKALAGQVAASLPAAPVTATAEAAFETAMTAAADGLLIAALGQAGPIGVAAEGPTEAEANAVIDFMVKKGGDQLNALAAAAKAKVASLTNTSGGAGSGVAAGGVG